MFQTLAPAMTVALMAAPPSLPNLFDEIEAAVAQGKDAKALELSKAYVERNGARLAELDAVLDGIGEILLLRRRDPEAVEDYFGALKKRRLAPGTVQTVEEWLAAARDVEAFGGGKPQFETAKKRYRTLTSADDDLEDESIEDIVRALVPIVFAPQHERSSESLLMLGHAHSAYGRDQSAAAGRYYLKRLIRARPHTRPAQQAYSILNRYVRKVSTSSGEKSPPRTVLATLRRYRELARPKN